MDRWAIRFIQAFGGEHGLPMGLDLPELPVARAHPQASDLPTRLAVITNDDLKRGASSEVIEVHEGLSVASGFRSAESSVAKTDRP